VHVLFPLSLHTTIPFADIESVETVQHSLLYGIGIRTNLAGHVALATAWGPAIQLTLRQPVRTGILPRIWSTHAGQLRLTVERPEDLAAELNSALVHNKQGALA
jgi:hypothetical protein